MYWYEMHYSCLMKFSVQWNFKHSFLSAKNFAYVVFTLVFFYKNWPHGWMTYKFHTSLIYHDYNEIYPPTPSKVAKLGFCSKKLRNALKPIKKIRFLVFEIWLKIHRISWQKKTYNAQFYYFLPKDAQCSETNAR